MLCFEVYRNGEKLCTAGMGEYGILHAMVEWVSHAPEKIACWVEDGYTDVEPLSLVLKVSGGIGRPPGMEHLDWIDTPLAEGDEVTIRIVDLPVADEPSERRVDLRPSEEFLKQYARQLAQSFGWEIHENPDVDG